MIVIKFFLLLKPVNTFNLYLWQNNLQKIFAKRFVLHHPAKYLILGKPKPFLFLHMVQLSYQCKEFSPHLYIRKKRDFTEK